MKKQYKLIKMGINKLKFGIVLAAAVMALAMAKPPLEAYAFNVTPINVVEMYSTSGTPVYATPDVFSPVIVYLDRFTNVRVNGITDNGFFRVDLNGTYYIPGPFMLSQVGPVKTEKEKALENLEDFADAYRTQLGYMGDDAKFALVDVTGDGIPEIIDEAGREIYTYYDKRAVMIYYSENPVTLYYSKTYNRLIGKYAWNKNEMWEVYNKDVSLLPWGQFKCISTDVSPYKGNMAEISREYTNNPETRGDIYNILKNILNL